MPIGTNPWYTYRLPSDFDTSQVAKVRFVIRQRDGVKVVKTENDEDVKIEGNLVNIRLTQEDTFRLNAKLPGERQLRIKTKAGDLFKTKPETFMINDCLDREVL